MKLPFGLMRFRMPILLGVTAGLSWSQATRLETVQVSGPRPLAAAADLLESRYAVAISYEDPLYVFAGDLIDQTEPTYRLMHPNVRAVIPRGGTLKWTNIVNSSTRTLINPLATLQSVLAVQAASGSPGKFMVRQIGSGYVITPTKSKLADGTEVTQASPLDALITFPTQQRTGIQAINVICEMVSQATSQKVIAGGVPHNLLAQTTVLLGATNEPARDVLQRALDGLRWSNPRIVAPVVKLSWRLFYGADIQAYALNIHIVTAEMPAPLGGTVRRPLVQ